MVISNKFKFRYKWSIVVERSDLIVIKDNLFWARLHFSFITGFHFFHPTVTGPLSLYGANKESPNNNCCDKDLMVKLFHLSKVYGKWFQIQSTIFIRTTFRYYWRRTAF